MVLAAGLSCIVAKPIEARNFEDPRTTTAVPPLVPLDFTMENHNSCRPTASRGQKLKILRSSDSQSTVRIWRVSNDLPGEFTICEAARWIRARICPGFPSPTWSRRYFQWNGKKRDREVDGEETNHPSYCANVTEFLPTSIEHLAQKVAHYRRSTSRRCSRYNMNSLL